MLTDATPFLEDTIGSEVLYEILVTASKTRWLYVHS